MSEPSSESSANYNPSTTKDGHLAPWEVAKAFAFHEAIEAIAEHLGESASHLLGQRVDEFIASHLTLKGGGNPTPRAVRDTVKRCKEEGWYPGKAVQYTGGRKEIYSDHQKNEEPFS